MNVSARRPRADPAIGLYPGDARGPTCGSRRQLPGAYNDFEPVLFLRSGTRPDGCAFPGVAQVTRPMRLDLNHKLQTVPMCGMARGCGRPPCHQLAMRTQAMTVI